MRPLLSVLRMTASSWPRPRCRPAAVRAPRSASHRPFSQTCRRRQQTPTSVAGLLEWKPAAPVAQVAVDGFVRSVRTSKAYVFVALGDGSSLASLQAVLPVGLADGLANGAAVRLRGAWTASPGAGQSHELHVDTVDILGPSDAKTFPIQKKYQTPEFLRTLPHLRPRIPFNTTLLRLRSDVIGSVGRFFACRDFVQTHPPVITSSDCEGAGEVFAVSGGRDPSTPFFRHPKYLTVSTQLHLEALAQAVGRVWTLSPTFRAEESNTPRHLSEFYMLEAEAAFVDRLDDLLDLAEDLLRAVAADLQGSRLAEELLAGASQVGKAKNHDGNDRQDRTPPDVLARRWTGLTQAGRWPRITYADALRLLAAAPVSFEHAPTPGAALQTEHERYLAQTVGGHTPVFVTHYPRESKAFYMRPTADDPTTVDCFDLLVPEFCEIAGGSMREHRLAALLAAMRSRGMRVPGEEAADAVPADADAADADPAENGSDLDWYVDLRRWGCPPHGGFGIGFDRLLCYLSGVQTIRDTVAFPRWFGRCDC